MVQLENSARLVSGLSALERHAFPPSTVISTKMDVGSPGRNRDVGPPPAPPARELWTTDPRHSQGLASSRNHGLHVSENTMKSKFRNLSSCVARHYPRAGLWQPNDDGLCLYNSTRFVTLTSGSSCYHSFRMPFSLCGSPSRTWIIVASKTTTPEYRDLRQS